MLLPGKAYSSSTVTRRPRFTSSLTSQALRHARPSPEIAQRVSTSPSLHWRLPPIFTVMGLPLSWKLHVSETPSSVLVTRQLCLARSASELRLAGALEVRGRAAHHAVVAGELRGDEVGALQVGDADGEVEALVLEVDHALGQVQRDREVRVLGDERREMRWRCACGPNEVGAVTMRRPEAFLAPTVSASSAERRSASRRWQSS